QSAMAQAGHGLIALPPSLAVVLLVLGGMLEVLGPVCILLDFYRRQAALLFVFYVIATAVLFHNFWSFPFNSNEWTQNFWPFLKNFGVCGGFSLRRGLRGDDVAARPLLLKAAISAIGAQRHEGAASGPGRGCAAQPIGGCRRGG